MVGQFSRPNNLTDTNGDNSDDNVAQEALALQLKPQPYMLKNLLVIIYQDDDMFTRTLM